MKTNPIAVIELPVQEEHGIPVMQDFLTEIQRRFDVEKDIKNSLISFVCLKGLYGEFNDWRKLNNSTTLESRVEAISNQVIASRESEVCDA